MRHAIILCCTILYVKSYNEYIKKNIVANYLMMSPSESEYKQGCSASKEMW